MKKTKKPEDQKKLTPFSSKLRKARLAKGLTARAVAKLCGVSQSYISRLENQPGLKLSAYRMAKLANVLEVPLDYLENDAVTNLKDDVKDTVFITRYRRLNPTIKEYMRKIITCFE